MLTNKSFIKWANENVVVLVSHNELGHDAIETKVDGKTVEQCPLYPGLTCRQHCDIAVETDNSRDETLPVVDFVELCPNSWLIRPDGKVDAISESAQFSGSGVKKAVAVVQKALGKPMSRARFAKVGPHVEKAIAAIEDEEWKVALEAFAKALAVADDPPKSLTALVAYHMGEIDGELDYLFDEALEEETDSARTAGARALLEIADVGVGGQHLKVRARIVEWLGKK